ncbi:serine hydrolase, partial [candidate division KSB1 bacterium]|nr:serine hydrolase [candidate division KSB1 bacterium]
MFYKMKNPKQSPKLSIMTTWLLFLLICIFSGFVIRCHAGQEEKQEIYKDILGYWQSYRTDIAKDDPGLIKVAINPQGKLAQSIIYDTSPQCRIWINNEDISYQDGHLELWGDEFKGKMSADRHSLQLEYRSRDGNVIPFVWERLHDQQMIQFLDNLEASQGGAYPYEIPAMTDDGWTCASLSEVGIDTIKMNACIRRIRNGDYQDLHSLLMVKNSKLVLEEYFGAAGKIHGPFVNQVLRDRVQMIASVTKSVNSILIGIAQVQGQFPNLDAPAFELFPEYSALIKDGREQIQLRHLLTMSAGLQWNELSVPYSNPRNDAMVMHQRADLIQYCLEKPMVQKPGEKFVYHTGLSVILGEILKRSVGIPADQFAAEYLFKPLGVTTCHWSKTQQNLVDTGGGLALRPRDMAKLG